jgi:beta-1,4-mannosyl-glycoprotein beta-1,4-N-acetylglucosaminyltransferase
MKIFDCFMYFDEDTVLDVRLNYLNDYVDKFVIIEAEYNHKGERRKPKFNIKKFHKFEDKIIYLLVNQEPPFIEEIDGLESEDKKGGKLIMNALKRENFQRNHIAYGLTNATDEDWIIISDLDEIPNLKDNNLKNIKSPIIFFKQLMMYYKFNLILKNYPWIGSKACKKKDLKSPQWLRNIKDRAYSWWRLDTFFSETKYIEIDIIENGGWHFSYLKSPEDIEKKLKSYLHHTEYELNPVGIKNIKEMIINKKTIYNLKVDSRLNKFDGGNKLEKIDLNLLPSYILENKNKFKEWIEE